MTDIELADIDRRLARVESSWKNFLVLNLIREKKTQKTRHPFGRYINMSVKKYEYIKEDAW
mgnify:CR=1 FL=1